MSCQEAFQPHDFGTDIDGEMALMYGKGDDVMAIEDMSMSWGMTVFEGGAELDEYSKVALLSMMAWHIHTDAVRRRRQEINQGGFTNWMQINSRRRTRC